MSKHSDPAAQAGAGAQPGPTVSVSAAQRQDAPVITIQSNLEADRAHKVALMLLEEIQKESNWHLVEGKDGLAPCVALDCSTLGVMVGMSTCSKAAQALLTGLAGGLYPHMKPLKDAPITVAGMGFSKRQSDRRDQTAMMFTFEDYSDINAVRLTLQRGEVKDRIETGIRMVCQDVTQSHGAYRN